MEAVDTVKGFFSSKLGKLLIILVVIAIVIYFAMKGYEMVIYKGMTKKQLLKKLAQMRGAQHIDWVMTSDTNYLSATSQTVKDGIIQWYRDNLDWKTQLTQDWINKTLTEMGIDSKNHSGITKEQIIPLIVI